MARFAHGAKPMRASLSSLVTLFLFGCTVAAGAEFEGQKRDAKAQKTPVLLDTDFGSYLDDACALALLLASPEVELKAITTSGGDCEDRAWMVRRMLKMVDRLDIPVAWGRDPQPKGEVTDLYQYRYHPAVLYGRTGKPADKDAADLLYETLQQQAKGKTVLLAIGPLTNVARLLEKHPESKEMLRQVVAMGGSLEERQKPELNVAQDVKAAQAVLASGVPLALVPFEVGDEFWLTPQHAALNAQTMLCQQLKTLYQLSDDAKPGLYDAIAAASVVDREGARWGRLRLAIDDQGFTTRQEEGNANVEVVRDFDRLKFADLLRRVPRYGEPARPRPLANFTKPVERGNLPARVHAFEDYETDIEKRWWLAGRLSADSAPQGKRAFKSVLTLDFDDLQGDLKTMYSAVVFNPVPGPPMGPKTRLSFRYRLQGTDQLRVQLYSLSKGYHRYLALKDLPQGSWQEATVDMTDMRRPDGSGGGLGEDERIDDIQFYVAPTARVEIDDVILYEAAPEGEKEPFPKRIIFTGWFDTGKQGVEWPGDFEIVEHDKPRKWKAAKSVMNKAFKVPILTVSFRGARPAGPITKARFKYRVTGGTRIKLSLVTNDGVGIPAATVKVAKPGDWQEATARFRWVVEPDENGDTPEPKFGEMWFYVTDDAGTLLADAELLIDDVLVYEPGE